MIALLIEVVAALRWATYIQLVPWPAILVVVIWGSSSIP